MDYELTAKVFKALSDPKRVQIMAILSCGERCACDILEYFDFTQPTLSHHMKVLINAGLVQTRKSGTWHHYSLNQVRMNELSAMVAQLTHGQQPEDCLCQSLEKDGCGCTTIKNQPVS